MKKVSVVGAGFAGLTVALKLAQKGFHVDLYESSSRVGGLLGTEHTPYGLAEQAANALIRTEKAEELFKELQLESVTPLPSAKKRFIFRETPRTWPLSILETLGFIKKILPRFIFCKSQLKPQTEETLQQWGLRNIGPQATHFLLEPAMQGIYGNEISGLSASLIFGPLFQRKKKDRYKGLLTGPHGMQELIDHLERRIQELGGKIHLNQQVNIKTLEGPVILATSARAASELLQGHDTNLAQTLSRIRMSSLMSVTLFFSKAQDKFQGFGCLIPRGLQLQALGVLMNSYIFKNRDKTYNETWILGGVHEEALLDQADAEILKKIAEERFRVLGSKENLLDYRIYRWKNALPYYDIELEKTLQALKEKPLPPDLYLHGNYLTGIGLSKILERSHTLAEEISNRYV